MGDIFPLYIFGHVPSSLRIWECVDVDAIMVSAYYILTNKNLYDEIMRRGVHDALGFDGLVFMDSGGYSFMTKGVEVDIDELISLYKAAGADYVIGLDYPMHHSVSVRENLKRWDKTLKSYEYFMHHYDDDFIPVVHAQSIDMLSGHMAMLTDLLGDFNFLGLGSVTSLSRTNIINVCNQLLWLKRNYKGVVHLFGVGSVLTMHLMFFAGADSMDSMAWRTKASYGVIQLPGVGDRYIYDKGNGRRYLTNGEKGLLNRCKCPSCEELSLEDRMDLLDSSFQARAVHNAWVLNEEYNAIKSNDESWLIDKCREVLTGKFKRPFRYVFKKKYMKR